MTMISQAYIMNQSNKPGYNIIIMNQDSEPKYNTKTMNQKNILKYYLTLRGNLDPTVENDPYVGNRALQWK